MKKNVLWFWKPLFCESWLPDFLWLSLGDDCPTYCSGQYVASTHLPHCSRNKDKTLQGFTTCGYFGNKWWLHFWSCISQKSRVLWFGPPEKLADRSQSHRVRAFWAAMEWALEIIACGCWAAGSMWNAKQTGPGCWSIFLIWSSSLSGKNIILLAGSQRRGLFIWRGSNKHAWRRVQAYLCYLQRSASLSGGLMMWCLSGLIPAFSCYSPLACSHPGNSSGLYLLVHSASFSVDCRKWVAKFLTGAGMVDIGLYFYVLAFFFFSFPCSHFPDKSFIKALKLSWIDCLRVSSHLG